MDKVEIIAMSVLIGLFVLLLFCVYTAQKCDGGYQMPNGVICKYDYINNRATHEFRQCSDGKAYINPETYIQINSCEQK